MNVHQQQIRHISCATMIYFLSKECFAKFSCTLEAYKATAIRTSVATKLTVGHYCKLLNEYGAAANKIFLCKQLCIRKCMSKPLLNIYSYWQYWPTLNFIALDALIVFIIFVIHACDLDGKYRGLKEQEKYPVFIIVPF